MVKKLLLISTLFLFSLVCLCLFLMHRSHNVTNELVGHKDQTIQELEWVIEAMIASQDIDWKTLKPALSTYFEFEEEYYDRFQIYGYPLHAKNDSLVTYHYRSYLGIELILDKNRKLKRIGGYKP